MSQHPPNPSDPAICKLWLRYAKRGRLRFTSHRDVARVFERALRRAGMPMAYSQGFNPHPKISWVGAAPTGTASEAEYVEIALAAQPDLPVACRELDAALPDGLRVIDATFAGPGGLADRVEAARWRIELPGVDTDALARAVEAFLQAGEVLVERQTKSGERMLDVRAAVTCATVGQRAERAPDGSPASDAPAAYGILTVVVLQGSPAVRPDDVVSALGVVAGLRPPVPAKATRTEQGRVGAGGKLVDPFDRVAGVQEPGTAR